MPFGFLKRKKKTDELKEQIISSPETVLEQEIEEKAPFKIQKSKEKKGEKLFSLPKPEILPKEKVETFIPKIEKVIPSTKPERKKEILPEKGLKSEEIDVVETFLTQLAEEIGRNNVYEIVKMKKTSEGWTVFTKINGALYEFKLNEEGNVLSYEELSES